MFATCVACLYIVLTHFSFLSVDALSVGCVNVPTYKHCDCPLQVHMVLCSPLNGKSKMSGTNSVNHEPQIVMKTILLHATVVQLFVPVHTLRRSPSRHCRSLAFDLFYPIGGHLRLFSISDHEALGHTIDDLSHACMCWHIPMYCSIFANASLIAFVGCQN